jgi:hypothetical protein
MILSRGAFSARSVPCSVEKSQRPRHSAVRLGFTLATSNRSSDEGAWERRTPANVASATRAMRVASMVNIVAREAPIDESIAWRPIDARIPRFKLDSSGRIGSTL